MQGRHARRGEAVRGGAPSREAPHSLRLLHVLRAGLPRMLLPHVPRELLWRLLDVQPVHVRLPGQRHAWSLDVHRHERHHLLPRARGREGGAGVLERLGGQGLAEDRLLLQQAVLSHAGVALSS